WEYACRAGTATRYFFGDDEEDLGRYANVADASFRRQLPEATHGIKGDDGFAFTAPVKSFRPNPWKLYDMHGNVWQWCGDGKRKYKTGFVKDPVGPESGARVHRGGSWEVNAWYCRAAYRNSNDAGDRYGSIGFRVACLPPR